MKIFLSFCAISAGIVVLTIGVSMSVLLLVGVAKLLGHRSRDGHRHATSHGLSGPPEDPPKPPKRYVKDGLEIREGH